MRVSLFPELFNFIALFALPDNSADMECAKQMQTVVSAYRWKAFYLSQDGGRKDLFDILGDCSLK